MSATTVYEGLAEIYASLAGVQNIILGEPTAAHELPAIYTAYMGFDRPLRNSPPANNLTGMRHTFMSRLLIAWQDQSEAEAQLLALLDTIPDAIDADPHLGGRLTKGMAWCATGVTGFVAIAGTTYRIVDYTITVMEKRQGT